MPGSAHRWVKKALAWGLILAMAPLCLAQDHTGPLDLSDLPALRKALDARPAIDQPSVATSFRDLWDHPRAFLGRRVTVEGRVVRLFHQGPVGEFPAMVELWLATPAGDILCATCPEPSSVDPEAKPIPQSGQWITFTGTYFRKIGYPARDGRRIAPLVVGSRAPVVVEKHDQDASNAPPPARPSAWTPLGFWVVLAISATACLTAWRLRAAAWSSRKSRTRRDIEPDPPIEFIEDRGDVRRTEA